MTRKRNRCGMTIVECTVAFVVLTAALYTAAQMIVAVTIQQREATQRQLARQEAANLLERMYVLPGEQLVSRPIDDSELSETARQRLRGVAATATVADVAGAPPGKRIAIEIRWANKANRPARPVQLVAWRFPRETTP